MTNKNTRDTIEGKKEEELLLQVVALPQDVNLDGDIFGGWLLSQMDIAGVILAKKKVRRRVVTVAITSMSFVNPVYIGDLLQFKGYVKKVGKTSITVYLEAWAVRQMTGDQLLVTHGDFKYVALDENKRPVPILIEHCQS